jgi:hypothetical protein
MECASISIKERFILFCFCTVWLSFTASSELSSYSCDHYYFYHGRDYGSESLINPISNILNGGFGILQMDNRSNNLNNIDFETGVKNVTWNLSHPFAAINEVGYDTFFKNQIIPFSVNSNQAYYWPNYTLHLIGGGMSYRMIVEWFDAHNFKHPRTFSVITMTIYHFLNEVVENSNFSGYNTDPIADLYIFDPLGIVLFNSDRVSSFFSRTLNMADWSYQIAYDPGQNSLKNLGQNFVFKYWLNDKKDIGLFYHFGTHGELGLSFKQSDGDCLSFGAGLVANELFNISDKTNLQKLTSSLVMTAGVFYDRENSLMASLIYSKSQDYKLRFNFYPGLMHYGFFSPGIFLSLSQDDILSAGMSLTILPTGISQTY